MPIGSGNASAGLTPPAPSEKLHDPILQDYRINKMVIPRRPFWTVLEISKLLNLSSDTVRRMFRDEVGVLRFHRRSSLSRRRYETLRIPENVLWRVLEKYSLVKINP